MTSNKSKRDILVLKSSIAAVAVMFSIFAAPLISQQQSVVAHMVPSVETNNISSPSNITNSTTTPATEAPGSVFILSRASIPIDIPLKEGFVNGNPVFYINTDISDQKLAVHLTNTTGFRVNYAPLIAQAPSDAVAQFYVFKNGIKGTGTLIGN